MAASWNDIHTWFVKGKEQGATHMIVACDTYDWTDYPVYVQPGEQASKKVEVYQDKSMQKVMEVYNLALDINTQMKESPAWHL